MRMVIQRTIARWLSRGLCESPSHACNSATVPLKLRVSGQCGKTLTHNQLPRWRARTPTVTPIAM